MYVKAKCYKFYNKSWKEEEVYIPQEKKISIFLNNKRFVDILCTPVDIEDLIVGFLYSEEIIKSYEDIERVEIFESRVNVNLKYRINFENLEKTYTSGFGKGIMISNSGKKINSEFFIEPENLINLKEEFIKNMEIYKKSGAVHASCLASKEKVLEVKEDIGRHNTFDKIAGVCLKRKINTEDKIIFTTGRVSTDMILKSSRMGIPVVATLKLPTSNSIEVAEELGITLIGKIKNNSVVVFTNKERIVH